MNEEYLNLIQAEIDGLNSDSDSARAQSLMAEHPELQTAFDELKAVKLAIESLSEIEPPATLRASIMNAIPERAMQPTKSTESGSIWAGIVSLVKSPKPVSLAYAFSLGLIVAFVVATVLMPPVGTNSGQFAGTMGAFNMNGFETIANLVIEEDEKEGEEDDDSSVRVHQSRDMIIVEFTWDRGRPVIANIEYDEDFLEVTATRTERGSQNLTTRTGNGELNFSGDGPLKEFVTLTVRDSEEGDEEMKIGVSSGSRSLMNRSIFVRRGDW